MSDSKIQRAKKQCEKLKEMADEYWEMFEDYHKMELELERVKEIRIELRGEKDKQWEEKKQLQEELERVKEENKEHDDRWEELGGILGCDDCYLHHAEQLKKQLKTMEDIHSGDMKIVKMLKENWNEEQEKNKELKELLDAYKSDRDTEHIRYINAREEASDRMCEVAEALGIDYHGKNEHILDAIRKLKELNVKMEDRICVGEIAHLFRPTYICGGFDWEGAIVSMIQENKELRNTIEELCFDTKLKQKE